MELDEPAAWAAAAAGGAGQPAPMHVDDPEGAGGGAAPHDDANAAYLASLVGAVFGDAGIASNVLSCLRMDESVPLRSAGRLTRDAVAAFPWDWPTQRPSRTRVLQGSVRLTQWRACFTSALSVAVSDAYMRPPVTDADVALLRGVKYLTLAGCHHVTDDALQPLSTYLERLCVRSCSLSGAAFAHLAKLKEVNVRHLSGPDGRRVKDADLAHIAEATTVLLDAPQEDLDEGEDVSIITDVGLGFLRAVRRLRVPFGSVTGAGLALLGQLDTLELLLPFDVDSDAVVTLMSLLPPHVRGLSLERGQSDLLLEDHVVLPIGEEDIVEHGLDASLSRLRTLRLEGLLHAGALLMHSPALEKLVVYDCQGLDTANFARLGQLHHLAVWYAQEWGDAGMLSGLRSLVSLRLHEFWHGLPVLERLPSLSLPLLRSVRVSDISDDIEFKLKALAAVHSIGPGTVVFNPGEEYEITWAAALPAACACCGRGGTYACPAWWRARHPPARGDGSGGGWGGDDDDDDE
jgi:hypothetical protein